MKVYLKHISTDGFTRTKIWNTLARMKFMLDFYLKNYFYGKL